MEISKKKIEIDQIDRKIINILQADASLSHATIGEKIELSASSVNERIRKLRTNQVIKRIVAIADPESLGTEIFAYVMVSVTGPENERQFGRAMASIEEVLECHHVTGEYSYLLKVRTQNTRSLENLIMNKIKAFSGVTHSFTQIVLSSAKEDTAIYTQGDF